MIDLGTFSSDFNESEAVAINSNGHVVGTLYRPGHIDPHIFLYQDSQMRVVGKGFVWDINSWGEIVGSDSNGAFLYANGKLVYLSDLQVAKDAGIKIDGVSAINDLGQIVCSTYLANTSREQHVLVLTPRFGP